MPTSSTVTFYKGFYTGGTPTVLSANPFDVAQDLSTGNLWQYTGNAWVAPSWQTSITFWLAGGTTVCERLQAEDTKIPATIHVYYGTDEHVPAELALSADDLAIQHNVGNYNLHVNVLRQDATTDTVVDVPFPEGYIISTDDGDWTILKNFTQCVGYDYATVSLAWTTTADGTGPQSVDYVTSSGATIIASTVVSGALVEYPTSSAVEQMISSGGVISGALISGMPFSTTVNAGTLTLSGAYGDEGGLFAYTGDFQGARAGLEIKVGEWDANPHGTATLYADDDITLSAGSSLVVSGGTVTLQNTYIASDEETVVSNTLSMTGYSLNMGCNDPDLGEWHASFDTQAIALSVQDSGIFVDFESVRINALLYVSSSLVLQTGFSDVTLEADDSGGVTINGEVIATQPWVQSQISGISTGITSADAANIASSVLSSGGYVNSQYVSTAITSAGETEGYITSSAADELASSAASSATSGVLFSGAEFVTSVGDYLLTYTSSGGLMVSGGGVQLQVSSGAVIASASSYDEESGTSRATAVQLTSVGIVASGVNANITASASDDGGDQQAHVTITSGGVNINVSTPTNDANVAVEAGSVTVSGTNDVAVSVNSRPVATQLVTSTDTTTTSASIAELAGGTAYVYTEPLTELTVESVVNTTVEDRLQFTLASGGSVGIPASCGLCPSGFVFEGGKSYLVAVMGGNVVAAEYQPGV